MENPGATYEELKKRLDEMQRVQAIRPGPGELIFKVAEKGGVSVYGLGRFPVTMYYNQWLRIFEAAEDIKKFMEANKSKLKLRKEEDK